MQKGSFMAWGHLSRLLCCGSALTASAQGNHVCSKCRIWPGVIWDPPPGKYPFYRSSTEELRLRTAKTQVGPLGTQIPTPAAASCSSATPGLCILSCRVAGNRAREDRTWEVRVDVGEGCRCRSSCYGNIPEGDGSHQNCFYGIL